MGIGSGEADRQQHRLVLALRATQTSVPPCLPLIVVRCTFAQMPNQRPGEGLPYEPDPDYFGSGSIVYRSADPGGSSDTGTIEIEVLPVNDPPFARSDDYRMGTSGVLSIAAPGVLGNDGDVDDAVLSAALVVPAESGSVELAADGGFQFTPAVGQTGEVRFTYSVSDPSGAATVGSVTIHVTAIDGVSSTERQTTVGALVGFASQASPQSVAASAHTVRRSLVLMRSASAVTVQQMGFPLLLLLVAAAIGIGWMGKLRIIPIAVDRHREVGTVSVFSPDDGFGLIVADGGRQELFFHVASVQRRDRQRLGRGDAVSFSVVPGEHRSIATRVQRVVEADQHDGR